MITGLNKSITAAGEKIRYDAQCKKVLADRQVLAWILKYATEEFANMPLDKIRLCIEDSPQLGNVRADGVSSENRGKAVDGVKYKKYNPKEREYNTVTGMTNESSIPGEGAVYYDIRFKVFLPVGKGEVVLLVNLEAQKKFYTGYPLVTRGIFYGARMISAQLDTEFNIPHYADIKKVYSIWLCMDAPEYIGNAICKYHIEKTDVFGSLPSKKEDYDKLAVVLVCLNDKSSIQTEFTEVMSTLLSVTIDVEHKKEILKKRYHFVMEKALEEEVDKMCNLSELVWEKGVNEGRNEGKIEGKKLVVANMLRKGMPKQDIAELAECSLTFIEEVRQTELKRGRKTEMRQ